MRGWIVLVVGMWGFTVWAAPEPAPAPATVAAKAERQDRWLRRPSTWQMAAGWLEMRDSHPRSLILVELQFPLWRNFFGSLGGALPPDRRNFHYQWGTALHFYSRPPYRGLWVHAGYHQDALRSGEGQGRVRGGIGWRWHALDAPASFGVSLGPERTLSGGKWGAAIRVDVGTDFSLGSVFW